ncbi:MAG: UDP-2,3-diacylglucosamine diphosphatase, partial [Pseudomonadota bacterium]
MRHRLEFRTVWLSDVHLGSPQCRAVELLEFLLALDAERVYLVGDIIDFERLHRRWHWPAAHTRVLERLEQMARTGTDVVWVPGNHDRVLRSMIGQRIGAIRIQRYANHVTAGGDHLLVT